MNLAFVVQNVMMKEKGQREMSAIYVSRYSNRELLKDGYYPVGISLGSPKWPLGYELRGQCYSLAPKGYMFDYEPDRFRKAYFDKLDEIGEGKIIGIVRQMRRKAEEEGKSLVFLCYEDIRVEGQWCHRTVFADWWENRTGEKIEELPDPSEPKTKKPKAKEQAEAKAEEAKEEWNQLSIFDFLAS